MAWKAPSARPRRRSAPSQKAKDNRPVPKATVPSRKGKSKSQGVRKVTVVAKAVSSDEQDSPGGTDNEKDETQDLDAFMRHLDESQFTPKKKRQSTVPAQSASELIDITSPSVPPPSTQPPPKEPENTQQAIDALVDPTRNNSFSFDYNVQYQALLGKAVFASSAQRVAYRIGVLAGHCMKKWFAEQEDDSRELKRIELTAIVSGKKILCNDFKETKDWGVLLASLKEAYLQKKNNLLLSAVGTFVPKVTPSAAPVATPAPSARSTTAQMLVHSSVERDNMESDGNYAVRIAERWPCKLNTCKASAGGTKGTCWQKGGRDIPECHMPVYGAALAAWSASIAKGQLTVDDPGSTIALQLQDMKREGHTASREDRKLRKRKHRRLDDSSNSEDDTPRRQGGVTYNYYTAPPPQKTPRKSPRRQSIHEDPFQLDSSQTEPVDRFKEFIDWCRSKPLWRGYSRALDIIHDVLSEEAYDLNTLPLLGFEGWKRKSLREGWWYMILQSSRDFRIERKSLRHEDE